MVKVIFESPIGERLSYPDLDTLRNLILESSPKYWIQGSGSALIVWSDDNKEAQMRIFTHEQYGFYLQYRVGGDLWLSLEDRSLLKEIIECCDEWYVSVGLYITKEKAWQAIIEFCETGDRTNKINWISPEEVPDDGNW